MKKNQPRLFSYKITHDTGFAPNPFHGFCTLATCKPQIRKSKRVGDWIAGFTSKTLCGDAVGDERLVYLMKVTDKVELEDYWQDSRFRKKRPRLRSNKVEDKTGDNIYQPKAEGGFLQMPNMNHDVHEMQHDLSGKYALIGEVFYYFGRDAIFLPPDLRPTTPIVQSGHGWGTKDPDRVKRFLEYIQENYEMGIIGYPHSWPEESRIVFDAARENEAPVASKVSCAPKKKKDVFQVKISKSCGKVKSTTESQKFQVILSRKGFDDQYGGQASPILPDGTLLSLPIPAKDDTMLFSELNHNDRNYLDLIKELNSKTKIKDKFTCHLDPDIRKECLPRSKKWKPLFGQSDSALGHLDNQGVGQGDVFLFFGTFRQTRWNCGRLEYVKGAPSRHLIYGYLQVGKTYSDNFPKHSLYHSHTTARFTQKSKNAIFEASNSLSFMSNLPGAACLSYHDELVLSKDGESKSRWLLPDIFREVAISYHKKNSFKNGYFQSAAKGQEFVVSEGELLLEWVKNLIEKGTQF